MVFAADAFVAKMGKKVQECRELKRGCLHCSFGPVLGCVCSPIQAI